MYNQLIKLSLRSDIWRGMKLRHVQAARRTSVTNVCLIGRIQHKTNTSGIFWNHIRNQQHNNKRKMMQVGTRQTTEVSSQKLELNLIMLSVKEHQEIWCSVLKSWETSIYENTDFGIFGFEHMKFFICGFGSKIFTVYDQFFSQKHNE